MERTGLRVKVERTHLYAAVFKFGVGFFLAEFFTLTFEVWKGRNHFTYFRLFFTECGVE